MRPIAVLLVVLVAIGALISALLFMGEGSHSTVPVEPGIGVSREQGTTPDKDPATLSDAGGRKDPATAGSNNNTRVGLTQPRGLDSFDNGLIGQVQNRAGAPVAGAKVTLAFQSAELIYELEETDTEPVRQTVTNSRGEFEMSDIEPSDYYTLYIAHADYCPGKSTGVRVAIEGITEEPPIVMKDGSSLSGYVRDTGGAPIGGAELALDVNMFSQTPNPMRQTATSDANGFYSFNHVDRGMQTLIATADGFGTQAHGGMTFNGRDPIVKDIEMDIAAIIGGTVTDAATGDPIEGAQLLALNYSNSNRSSRDFVKSGSDGKFSLSKLSEGDYTLMVNAYGYNNDRVLRVQTGELNLSIKLKSKAEVRGNVVARDNGAIVESGTLQLRAVHKGTELTSAIDVTGEFENGEFVLRNVPAGDYVIEASAIPLGYAPTYSAPFTVIDGENLTGITVRINRGATIVGRVVDESGTGVKGAIVSTHDNNYTHADQEFYNLFGGAFPNNATNQKIRTEDDGSFKFIAMRPDVYQINVVADGYVRYVQRDIQLNDLEQRDLSTLQLSRGGVIKGTLYDAGGVPLPGGQVHLRSYDEDAPPERRQAKSDATGTYQIENIRPGNYTISATSSTLGGDNPFEDIANRKATESKIAVNEGRTLNHDLHLTGQPEVSNSTGSNPR